MREPYDLIVVGGGLFGPILAQRFADLAPALRVLVIERGLWHASGHTHNAASDSADEAVSPWCRPWAEDPNSGFPGLASCLGGRSVFFGGWSPTPRRTEFPSTWPSAVVDDLRHGGYLEQAASFLGVRPSTAFSTGSLYSEIIAKCRGIEGLAFEAAPLAAVKKAAGVEKFSTMSLLRGHGPSRSGALSVVDGCTVTALRTEPRDERVRVTGVATSKGNFVLSAGGTLVLAQGAIETARTLMVAGLLPPRVDLIAHLRSDIVIRISRSSAAHDARSSTAALLARGRADTASGHGHYHLQLTAATATQGMSLAELRSTIVDVESVAHYNDVPASKVVLAIRGVGEMMPRNARSHVTLTQERDALDVPIVRAGLHAVEQDLRLWDEMDRATDALVACLAGNRDYEVLAGLHSIAVPAGTPASRAIAHARRRQPLGSSHHEAGTAPMHALPQFAALDGHARVHGCVNLHLVGGACFPSVGSANPSLLGTALALRLATHLARNHAS